MVHSLSDRHPLKPVFHKVSGLESFDVIIKRIKNNRYLPKSDNVWISITVIFNFNGQHSFRYKEAARLISLTPRRLTSFSLVLAGSMDIQKKHPQNKNDVSYFNLSNQGPTSFYSPVLIHKDLAFTNSNENKVTFYDKVVFDNSGSSSFNRDERNKIQKVHNILNKGLSHVFQKGFLKDYHEDGGLSFTNNCISSKSGNNCPNNVNPIDEETQRKCLKLFNQYGNDQKFLEDTRNTNVFLKALSQNQNKKNKPDRDQVNSNKSVQNFMLMLSKENRFLAAKYPRLAVEVDIDNIIEIVPIINDACDDNNLAEAKKRAWIEMKLKLSGDPGTSPIIRLPICSKWTGDLSYSNRIVTTEVEVKPIPISSANSTSILENILHITITFETKSVLSTPLTIHEDTKIDFEITAIEEGKKFKNHPSDAFHRSPDNQGDCFSMNTKFSLQHDKKYFNNINSRVISNATDKWRVTDEAITSQTSCFSTTTPTKAVYDPNKDNLPAITERIVANEIVLEANSNTANITMKECRSIVHSIVSTDWANEYDDYTFDSWNFNCPNHYNTNCNNWKIEKNSSYEIKAANITSNKNRLAALKGECFINRNTSLVVGFYFCTKKLIIKNRNTPLDIIGTIITPKS